MATWGQHPSQNGRSTESTAPAPTEPWVKQEEIGYAEAPAKVAAPIAVVVRPTNGCWGYALPTGTWRELGQQITIARGLASQWSSVDYVISRESGWRSDACNSSSGACGIGQSLPCAKSNYDTPAGQINWAIDYMIARYHSPIGAAAFWQSHSWY